MAPTDPEIEAAIFALLRRALRPGIEARRDSDVAADLGLDSAEVLKVIADIEDQLAVNVPLNRLAQLRTVGDVVDFVTSLVRSPAR